MSCKLFAIALIVIVGSGQSQTSAKTQFEVASLKPVPAASPTKPLTGGPGTSDPGRISYQSATLSQLLLKAYGLTYADQISGPSWIDSDKYAIAAIVPQGATSEEFGIMLQNLLAERLAITLHHETKNLPAYVLTIAKAGSKLTPSANLAGADAPAARGPGAPRGPDGCPILAPGLHFMEGATDTAGLECDTFVRVTISELAHQLSGLLKLGSGLRISPHVVDNTGLEGAFDFKLKFRLNIIGPAMAAKLLADGAAGDPIGDNVSNLKAALLDQLGLSLRQSMVPFDTIVIDKAERVPTDN